LERLWRRERRETAADALSGAPHRSADLPFGATTPTATAATAKKLADGTYSITVGFVGATPPFTFAGTRNCTQCCADGNTDFDVSTDAGRTWINGTHAIMANGTAVSFEVAISTPPTHVRYTAAGLFPQCALYNGMLLPAAPFALELRKGTGGRQV
jgi:hypothetical protein